MGPKTREELGEIKPSQAKEIIEYAESLGMKFHPLDIERCCVGSLERSIENETQVAAYISSLNFSLMNTNLSKLKKDHKNLKEFYNRMTSNN